MANKIRSIELENKVVVTFQDNGRIQFSLNGQDMIHIHTSDLETIRDTAKKNGKAEAGNGVVQPEKEKV